MKRLLVFLICSVLALSSLSVAASAAETDTADLAADTEITGEAADAELEEVAADIEVEGIAADAELEETAAETDEIAPVGWSLLSESQFSSKLNSLRSKYPNGSIWEGVYYESGSAKAWTCWAYAAQMLREVFGVNFYADGMLNYKYYDSSGVCAGDWVRIDWDSHSIFITKVTSSGVYYTDGNGTGVYNQVRWDGYYSWSEFSSRFSYRLHLPGNNLTGNGVVHTVAYNGNGGTGSLSSQSVAPNSSFTLKSDGFSRANYDFDGYICNRSYDNTWYTTDAGWQSQSNINKYGYHYKVYPQGNTYTLGSPWIGGISSSTTFTFYAQWQPHIHTVAYNGNGGTGSMTSQCVPSYESFQLSNCEFTNPGYSFAGYICKRSDDNTWYTTDAGWQPQSEIYNNSYHYKIYPQGNTYTLGTPWIGGIEEGTTFTFYAQWLPDESTIEYAANYSGYNYILGSDLGADYANYIRSRSAGVYTVSVDSTERLNNADSLKIVGSRAGASGSDLAVSTSTNKGYGDGYSQAGLVGDDKTLTLHFYAKANVDGAKMYFRWGFSDTYTSVELSTNWKVYSVSLPKNRFCGSTLHPYFDKAGTYYLNSLALGDAKATNVVAETGRWAAPDQKVTRGSKIGMMPTPSRDGYEFLGWYTAAEGGNKVTADSTINESCLRLYAHWRKSVSYTPVKTEKHNGHIYELYDNVMGWEDAARFCEAQGGHLVTIGSEAENRFAYSMISDRQGYCWIGLHYLHIADKWGWVDNTSLSDYNNWFKASYGTTDSGEYYALLYPMNFGTNEYAQTWDKCKGSDYYSSYYGYYNSFFICEYDYDDQVFRGDTDGNGTIDIVDATLIQRYEALLALNLSESTRMRGDVDGNNITDVIDVAYLLRYLASMDTPYAIGEWIKS